VSDSTRFPSATSAASVRPVTTSTAQYIFDLPDFTSLEALATYWVDPDFDPSTSLRVLYTIPADGWSGWAGALKIEDAPGQHRHVAVSIVTVDNLVVNACNDHAQADPPVGPTVDDLAEALANLAPFQVTEAPTDISAYGYSGQHLQFTVPDLEYAPISEEYFWPECNEGLLRSWIAPVLSYAFWGYTSPNQIEEFWILDVEGTRLVIEANWSPDSPTEDIEEMRSILDSIEIQP
jgi:hypothetical protein